jgi:hypothetical protein
VTNRGAAFAGAAPRPGEIMQSFPLLTWHDAIRIAFRLADENGWRYRVYRDSLGGWNVVRAGRKK